jgi:hypothetical protein
MLESHITRTLLKYERTRNMGKKQNTVNEALAGALITNEATTVLAAQLQPLHLYTVYGQKTSHKGVSCGFLMPFELTAGTPEEAKQLFIEQAGGSDAIMTDAVGTWKIVVNCVA